MGQSRRLAVAGVMICMASTLLPVGSFVAAAGMGQPVGDAQVVTLDGSFSPPEVGRLPELAGPGFVATSVQAAFFGQVSSDSGDFAPATPGDELLYLAVSLETFAPPLGTSERTYDGEFAPSLAVNFEGRTVALPQSPSDSINGVAGSAYGETGELYAGQWLVAMPKGAPVSLTATESGFTQSVDVRGATRVGEAPSVLYRSSAGSRPREWCMTTTTSTVD